MLVASKAPLPNYRADLDPRRRAEHEVGMSEQTQDIVSRAVSNNDGIVSGGGDDVKGGGRGGMAAPKRHRSEQSNKALTHDPQLCATIAASEARRRDDPKVAAMETLRAKLPAFRQRDELLAAIARSQVLVVSGETGCGKTTQLPQFVLERELLAGNGARTSIICTQPRRISAISVAARVAHERGESVGHTVGYQIRLEAKRSEPKTLNP